MLRFNEPKRGDFKKYLNIRYLLIGMLLLFGYLLFSDYVVAIILTGIFIPLGIMSIRVTRFLPRVATETITSCSGLMGYLFGPWIGLFFGLFVGGIGYIKNSMGSQFVLLMIMLQGFSGFLAGTLNSLSFTMAYLITMSARNLLSFLLGPLIGGNPLENVIHTITDILWNSFFMYYIMKLIYELVAHII
ncbi:hypothetical protein JW930_04875 [Candidatus Woesearchaeota archaeon]|nr:hypothetical protein [Candidatus Woesearchaeota archaeon]